MITKLNFQDRTIKSYAIRKLTPKECFRLMGVRDDVIVTMQSSNAPTARMERKRQARRHGGICLTAIQAGRQLNCG